MKKNSQFENYNLYDINSKAPSSIKKKIKSQLLPLKLIKYTFGILFFLFCSPLLLLFSKSYEDKEVLSSIILTESFAFLIFALLAGIILSFTKNPRLQELKNLFGYTE